LTSLGGAPNWSIWRQIDQFGIKTGQFGEIRQSRQIDQFGGTGRLAKSGVLAKQTSCFPGESANATPPARASRFAISEKQTRRASLRSALSGPRFCSIAHTRRRLRGHQDARRIPPTLASSLPPRHRYLARYARTRRANLATSSPTTSSALSPTHPVARTRPPPLPSLASVASTAPLAKISGVQTI